MSEQQGEIRKNALQEIDYQKIAKIILSRWYWVVSTLIIAFILSYFYIWYTPKLYATSATLKFEDKQANLSSIIDLDVNKSSQSNKIQSEAIVLKSSNVIAAAVELLDWKVSYFLKGRVRTTDLYPNKPFLIKIINQDTLSFYNKPVSFLVNTDERSFNIEYQIDQKTIKSSHKFNEIINLPGIKFSIKRQAYLTPGVEYSFKFNHKEDFYGRVGSNLGVAEVSKYSSIASVSKTGDNPYFITDALNAVIKVYLKQNLLNKTQSANQIIDFIDIQLQSLKQNVQSAGEKLTNFKQRNNFLNLDGASSTILSDVTRSETATKQLELQLILLQRLKQQMETGIKAVTLNFDLNGNVDGMLSTIISQWNGLINQRLSLLKTYNESSQSIKEIDKKLSLLKTAALQNINASIGDLKQQKTYNQNQLSQSYAKLGELPDKERELFGLQRDYDISEKIYRYLSEKKLESQISKSSVLPDAIIVDSAVPNIYPISPNTKSIWQSAWILGLAAGIGLIFLVRMLNPYIYDKETIESLTNTPIIGLIRHYPYDIDPESNQILSMAQPKSLFAESVRSVRTNLSFIASEKKSKVVCITSEISGEGKSFVSLNIASSLALIDKKVIFIAADLRRSKIQFKLQNKDLGLSSYLSNQAELDQIINKSDQSNLDVIVSGKVPPNPAELMYGERLNTLIEQLKLKYDFILFDTAPIGLVSDALPLIRISDVNLFVIRTGKSKYSAASIPDRIANEYHLNNTFIILNDFRVEHIYSRYYSTNYNNSNNYYGYYYIASDKDGAGYYTRDKRQKWWTKAFRKLTNKFKG